MIVLVLRKRDLYRVGATHKAVFIKYAIQPLGPWLGPSPAEKGGIQNNRVIRCLAKSLRNGLMNAVKRKLMLGCILHQRERVVKRCSSGLVKAFVGMQYQYVH